MKIVIAGASGLVGNALVAALRADAILCDDLGSAFCEQFLRLKRAEWDARASAVTDWELSRYAG